MDYKRFLQTWNGALSENKFHRVLIPLLILTNLVSTVGWLTKDRVTVLVPQGLSEEAEIASKKASGGYKKSWGLFVSQMLGNITPGNADFMLNTLAPMLESSLYVRFRQSVTVELDDIKKNNLTTSFEPKQVTYEAATDKVFVAGRTIIEAVGGTRQQFDRVFELQIQIKNGQPLITSMESYQGQPRTLDYMSRHARDIERAEQQAANSNATR